LAGGRLGGSGGKLKDSSTPGTGGDEEVGRSVSRTADLQIRRASNFAEQAVCNTKLKRLSEHYIRING